MDEIIDNLMQLDLAQNDAIVYLWLLKHENSNPTDIAEGTGIRRPRVYDSLKRLIERGFVVQEMSKKRANYSATDPRILMEFFKTQINFKREAFESVREFLTGRPPSSRAKGVYFFNSGDALLLEIQKLIQRASKTIFILVIIPSSLKTDLFLPFELLSDKSSKGVYVTLILNINAKNWESCLNLSRKKAKIYHYPHIEQVFTVIHLIDDESLCISAFDQRKGKVIIENGLVFNGDLGLISVYNFLFQNFIDQSISLESRLGELKKSIIYPTDRLKTLFGARE